VLPEKKQITDVVKSDCVGRFSAIVRPQKTPASEAGRYTSWTLELQTQTELHYTRATAT
jgi:hypothetical protein